MKRYLKNEFNHLVTLERRESSETFYEKIIMFCNTLINDESITAQELFPLIAQSIGTTKLKNLPNLKKLVEI